MSRYEYLRLRLDNFPEDVIAQYNLKDIITSNGYMYIEVRKGMYGLPQAGYWLKKSCKQDWKSMATSKASIHQVSGSMN